MEIRPHMAGYGGYELHIWLMEPIPYGVAFYIYDFSLLEKIAWEGHTYIFTGMAGSKRTLYVTLYGATTSYGANIERVYVPRSHFNVLIRSAIDRFNAKHSRYIKGDTINIS